MRRISWRIHLRTRQVRKSVIFDTNRKLLVSFGGCWGFFRMKSSIANSSPIYRRPWSHLTSWINLCTAKLRSSSSFSKKSEQSVHFFCFSSALARVRTHYHDFSYALLTLLHSPWFTCLNISELRSVKLPIPAYTRIALVLALMLLLLRILFFPYRRSFLPYGAEKIIPRCRKNYPSVQKKLSLGAGKTLPWDNFPFSVGEYRGLSHQSETP